MMRIEKKYQSTEYGDKKAGRLKQILKPLR